MSEARQAYETVERLEEALGWRTDGRFDAAVTRSADAKKASLAALASGSGMRALIVIVLVVAVMCVGLATLTLDTAELRATYAEEASGQDALPSLIHFTIAHQDGIRTSLLVATVATIVATVAAVAFYKLRINPREARDARRAEYDRLVRESDYAAAECVGIYNEYAMSCTTRGEMPAVSWEQFDPQTINSLLSLVTSGRASTLAGAWAIIDHDAAVTAARDEQRRIEASGVAVGVVVAAAGIMGAIAGASVDPGRRR